VSLAMEDGASDDVAKIIDAEDDNDKGTDKKDKKIQTRNRR